MSNPQRYTDISTIEALAAEQHLRYTFNNGIVVFSTPDGDKTFNWLHASGIPTTLQWLKARISMNELNNIPPHVQTQYTNLYGPYYPHGEYKPGDTITLNNQSQQVLWAYLSASNGLVYLVETANGDFPYEVKASEVHA